MARVGANFDLRILDGQGPIKFNQQLPMFNWHYPFSPPERRLADAQAPFSERSRLEARRRAIYLHVPFCSTICSFCLFQKGKHRGDGEVQTYLEALCKEIEVKKALLGRCKVDAIFVGGGTPSLLEPRQIEKLGEALHCAFDLRYLQEFTFEVEAKTATQDKLNTMREIGVNRVSFGAQTFVPRYRELFSLDAPISSICATADSLNAAFPYTNVDVLYGMAGR